MLKSTLFAAAIGAAVPPVLATNLPPQVCSGTSDATYTLRVNLNQDGTYFLEDATGATAVAGPIEEPADASSEVTDYALRDDTTVVATLSIATSGDESLRMANGSAFALSCRPATCSELHPGPPEWCIAACGLNACRGR